MEKLLTIKQIEIYNFRSIENIVIKNVGNINALVGPNEGGKSNILKALEWFSKNDKMSDNDVPKGKNIKDNDVIVKIIFKITNPEKYLLKVQEIIEKDSEFNKYLKKDIMDFSKINYFLIKKQKNGKKDINLFNTSGELINLISININKYIQQKLKNGQLNTNQIIKDGIKEFLINKGLKPQPNQNEIDTIFNHQDIKDAINDIDSQLKPIFDREIAQIKNIDEIRNLKDKLLNHKIINNISSNTYTENIKNIQIQWNAKDVIKTSIECYFDNKLEKPIKQLSIEDASFVDKLEIPKFILYSEKIELKNKIKKEGTWLQTITEEKHSLYYRLFKVTDIQTSELDARDCENAQDYLENRLIKISKSLDERWNQKNINISPYISESLLSIGVVDLNEKREQILKTSPKDRSDGFQWFLGYFITLNYIKNSETNQILLLDDPGLYLHPDGQKDFLKELEDLSKSTQVFYSTHLISLFSEDHLDRIYLVESENSKTKVKKPWKSEHKDVIEPIRHALGIDILIFKNTKRIFFVEGITDKFIIEGILYNTYKMDKDKLEELYVYPMYGKDDISDDNKIIDKIKFIQTIKCFNDKKNFLYILDGDARKLIENNKDIDEETKKCIKFMGKQDQEMEDIIEKDFYLKCIKEVYYPLFIEDKVKIKKLDKLLDKLYSENKENSISKITKFLGNQFEKEYLGDFDKVEVAKYIKRLLISESNTIKYLENIKNVILKMESNKEKIKVKDIEKNKKKNIIEK